MMLTSIYLLKTLTFHRVSTYPYSYFFILCFISNHFFVCISHTYFWHFWDLINVWMHILFNSLVVSHHNNVHFLKFLWSVDALGAKFLGRLLSNRNSNKKRLLNTLPDWHSVYTAFYLYNELLEDEDEDIFLGIQFLFIFRKVRCYQVKLQ